MLIHRTAIDEGPAFGAVLLAGIAAGIYANATEAVALVELRGEVTMSDPERAEA